jgi:hypothetical protein
MSMKEPGIITLICTRESFRPAPMEGVRWLAPNADFYRVQQAMRSNGLEPPAFEEWLDWHRQGYRFCARTPQGIIVAGAAVLKHSATEWELAAVRTQAAHQGQGHGRAVSSFITAYILGELPEAICHTAASNTAMLHVAESLGYQRA